MPTNINNTATAAIDKENTSITNTQTNQKKKSKVKGKGRGDAYTQQETLELMVIMEEIMPISAIEWETTREGHTLAYPDKNQTVESLCKRF